MRFLWILLGWSIITPSNADLFDDRLRSLENHGVLTAQFTEMWFASYLSEPLESSGSLKYYPSGKLVKIVRKPETIKYIVVEDRITMVRGDDKETINISNVPELSVGFKVLRNLLQGNRKNLEEIFAIQYRPSDADPEKWVLILIPKLKKLSDKVNKITIKGVGSILSNITIVYGDGNKLVTKIYQNED